MVNVQDVILRNFNGALSRTALYRALFDHASWTGGGTNGFWWLSSTPVSSADLAKSVREDLIGEIHAIAHLDDYLLAIPPTAPLLKIDPVGPLSLGIANDELPDLQRFARGCRIERAMADRDYARVRAHAGYLVPFFGELGHGHNFIALPTEHGSMVAAFTTLDDVEQFLATGSEDNRASVKFVEVPGDLLFAEIGPKIAEGVIVNIASARPFGFDRAACKLVTDAA
jgi:hypothetical protein